MDAEKEEEEEQERAQTEAEREVLEALGRLGKANLQMVTNAIGGNKGNIWKRLDALWRSGQLRGETIGKSFYYFLPEPNGKDEHGEQLDFIKRSQ